MSIDVHALESLLEEKIREDISEAMETGSASGELKVKFTYTLNVDLEVFK